MSNALINEGDIKESGNTYQTQDKDDEAQSNNSSSSSPVHSHDSPLLRHGGPDLPKVQYTPQYSRGPAPSMATRTRDDAYLRATVGGQLAICLQELTEVMPADPIEWIANWLYKSHDSQKFMKAKANYYKGIVKTKRTMEKQCTKRHIHIRNLVEEGEDLMEEIRMNQPAADSVKSSQLSDLTSILASRKRVCGVYQVPNITSIFCERLQAVQPAWPVGDSIEQLSTIRWQEDEKKPLKSHKRKGSHIKHEKRSKKRTNRDSGGAFPIGVDGDDDHTDDDDNDAAAADDGSAIQETRRRKPTLYRTYDRHDGQAPIKARLVAMNDSEEDEEEEDDDDHSDDGSSRKTERRLTIRKKPKVFSSESISVRSSRSSKKQKNNASTEDDDESVYSEPGSFRSSKKKTKKQKDNDSTEDDDESVYSEPGSVSSSKKRKRPKQKPHNISEDDDVEDIDDDDAFDPNDFGSAKSKGKNKKKRNGEPASSHNIRAGSFECDLDRATWGVNAHFGLICQHPVLGDMEPRPSLMYPETPEWWDRQGYVPQTLYDHEVYSRSNDDTVVDWDDMEHMSYKDFIDSGPWLSGDLKNMQESCKSLIQMPREFVKHLRARKDGDCFTKAAREQRARELKEEKRRQKMEAKSQTSNPNSSTKLQSKQSKKLRSQPSNQQISMTKLDSTVEKERPLGKKSEQSRTSLTTRDQRGSQSSRPLKFEDQTNNQHGFESAEVDIQCCISPYFDNLSLVRAPSVVSSSMPVSSIPETSIYSSEFVEDNQSSDS